MSKQLLTESQKQMALAFTFPLIMVAFAVFFLMMEFIYIAIGDMVEGDTTEGLVTLGFAGFIGACFLVLGRVGYMFKNIGIILQHYGEHLLSPVKKEEMNTALDVAPLILCGTLLPIMFMAFLLYTGYQEWHHGSGFLAMVHVGGSFLMLLVCAILSIAFDAHRMLYALVKHFSGR